MVTDTLGLQLKQTGIATALRDKFAVRTLFGDVSTVAAAFQNNNPIGHAHGGKTMEMRIAVRPWVSSRNRSKTLCSASASKRRRRFIQNQNVGFFRE